MRYGFDMASMLKCLLSELTLGNIGAEIPTYVRNDNSGALYLVDTRNTAISGKRPNGILESNREAIYRNNWLILGYITGDVGIGTQSIGRFAQCQMSF